MKKTVVDTNILLLAQSKPYGNIWNIAQNALFIFLFLVPILPI